MEKTDLAKLYRSYYSAKPQPQRITVHKAAYVAIQGQGDPSQQEFAARVEALYSVAYAVKFMCKWDGNDFVVPKLEGQWWFDTTAFPGISAAEAPVKIPREKWQYRLLLQMPDMVCEELVQEAIKQVLAKKRLQLAAGVHFFEMEEQACVQMLHAGPFDREPETLAVLQQFITAQGLQQQGCHHEIYLSDFRKTPPEKLRTILREPVKEA